MLRVSLTVVHPIWKFRRTKSAGLGGPEGPQGPPGEVSTAQLDAAISGTSSNSNAVGTLDDPFPDPDMEILRGRFNELVLALRR